MEKDDSSINTENMSAPSEEQKLDLKKIRESKGLTLREISRITRISHTVLGVIETERFESLPEPIYSTAFIKTYAEALGVDGEEILYRYSRYLKEQQKISGKPSGGLKKKSWIKSNYSLLMWGILTVAIVLFFVFYFFHQDYMEKRGAVKKQAVEEVYESPPVETSEAPEEKESIEQAVPESPISSEVVKKEEAVVQQKPENTVQEKTKIEKAVADAKVYKLAIKATELTWLKVAQDGASSLEILLQPGEKFERNAKERFLIVVGNAGGVDIVFDGKSLGTLGAHGEVVYLNLP